MKAEEYLKNIGLENVIGEEFFNDDDKSYWLEIKLASI